MEIDQKLAEQSIEELFDNAPCGYLATRADGTIIQVNKTFILLTGYTREFLLAGATFSELLSIGGKIYHETHTRPLLQMQGFVNEVAFDIKCPNREPLSVLVSATQKPMGEGGPILTLMTIFPATDRRKYEQELLSARRLADLATDTERKARESAENASRIKDEFLTLVSHELRTPLNAIVGWTQLLQRGKSLDEDQTEGLAVIARNARIQAQLIEDLLDMGRIISGKMRLDVQPVLLGEIIDAAIDTVKPAADAREIRLQKVLDPAVIVAGDPGRLQQVFWNLLTNAVKFTPKSGYIRIVMQRINSHVEVSVIDNGQGMTQDFISRAFERFSQSGSDATRQTKGLGLGLSIVKNIVEMHGGSVVASSDGVGKGSTFLINLPVTIVSHTGSDGRAHPRSAVATESINTKGSLLRGLKVLVVDDQGDARDVVKRVLTYAGAEVLAAASASEALRLIGEVDADILISDIGMPGEDGYELIRQVRMLGGGKGSIRAIALTAFARIEDRTQAMLAGFQMHLAKPVDGHELVVTVASLAGRRDPTA